MAMKPSVEPEFAEDANYPMDAEPEQGTPTKVDPAREDIGYRPNEHPTPQGYNFIIQLLAAWIRWFNDCFTRKITLSGHDWAVQSGGSTYNGTTWGGGIGVLRTTIPIVEGETIDNIRFFYDRGGAGQITLSVGWREYTGTTFVQHLVNDFLIDATGTGEEFYDVTAAAIEAAGIDKEAGPNEQYFLQVTMSNAANLLQSSVVTMIRTAS